MCLVNYILRKTNSVSYFLGDSAYRAYVRGNLRLGRSDGFQECIFVCPTFEADKAMKMAKGSKKALADALGLRTDAFGDGPVHRVDIKSAKKWNLRKANGLEINSNCFFNTPFSSKDRPDIHFVKKEDGFVSIYLENGNVVRIDYDNRGNGYVYVDNYCFEVINDYTTPAKDLARLNGKYVTVSGKIHYPNLKGYTGRTSGGWLEFVTNCVLNISKETAHFTLFENGDSFEVTENFTALFDCVNGYQDRVEELDSENCSFEEKTKKINRLRSGVWKNILLDRAVFDEERKSA